MTSQISTDRPAPFARGDIVETIKGAEFWGVLISIEHDDPENPGGTVKATAPGFRGTKHVYPLKQLRLRDEPPSQPVQELHELPRHAGEDELAERVSARLLFVQQSDGETPSSQAMFSTADVATLLNRIFSDSALLATVSHERDVMIFDSSSARSLLATVSRERDSLEAVRKANWDALQALAKKVEEGEPSVAALARAEAADLHLGNILYMFADLHSDDRTKAFKAALAYFNSNHTSDRVEPERGFVTRLVHETPLSRALSEKAS